MSERPIRRWKSDLEAIGLLDAGEYEPRDGIPYSTDATTLTQALTVLSNNVGVKVAARQRFRAFVDAAAGTLAWLERARDLLGLRGDRREWNPPPDPAG